jgi:hypothetical protein
MLNKQPWTADKGVVLHSSPSIIRILKSRMMRWHVARMVVGGKARRKEAARETKTYVGG